MTDQNGSETKRRNLEAVPEQPSLISERIKLLLSRALNDPASLSHDDIRQLAASVVYHLHALKNLTFEDS